MDGKPCDVGWCPALSTADSVYCSVHRRYPKLRAGWNAEDAAKKERASQTAKRREEKKLADQTAKNQENSKKRRGVQF